MQIDWLTVSAQIVNFLVLVWLLQHFLYGPITRAMAAREQRIADRVAAAKEAEDDAEAEAARLRAERRQLEEARERALEEAREAAADTRRELEREARAEVDEKKAAWHAQLRDERASFLDGLRRRAGETFYELARRALADLADADLEERMADGFVRRLHDLDDAARGDVRAAGAATVASRFELAPAVKRKLTKAIHDLVGTEIDVDYTAGADVAGGIVLHAGSRRLAWTLDDWLDGLEEAVRARLDTLPHEGERRREAAEAEA